MFSWLTRRRETVRAHEELWAPERAIGTDGLSHFQRRAEEALSAVGYTLRERDVRPISGGEPTDLYITGIVGTKDARLYIYQDGVQLKRDVDIVRLEDWDSESPDQMIEALRDALVRLDSQAA